jgi:hypothetical protein|tara:strand:+ start:38 stop:628 length:591 start_codon:yes stop_codon:yes gene_type:complete
MINFLNKNDPLSEHKNSLNITYPRSVNIIFGNYPYPDAIHNFMIDIKCNLDPAMENYSNVKGGMTDWNYFVGKPEFNKFMTFLINKHQISHPNIFQHFFEKHDVGNAWGNEIKKGDSLNYHVHHNLHGILYLTKGCDLILPELNLKITPEPGDYYIFPPEILHGFDPYEGENNRYSLIFNIFEQGCFEYEKKLANL